MKKIASFLFLIMPLVSCHKAAMQTNCNIDQVYADNAKKVTIKSGIWGTVSLVEGNCMPGTSNSTCRNCPVKRTVKIYQYTLSSKATPSNGSTVFFESFSTQLVSQVSTDDQGFYQADIPAGHYSVAIIENGKLYANGTDGQGGLNPIMFSGTTQNF